MRAVYAVGALIVVLAMTAVFGLIYAKVAEKMFSPRRNKKEIDK